MHHSMLHPQLVKPDTCLLNEGTVLAAWSPLAIGAC